MILLLLRVAKSMLWLFSVDVGARERQDFVQMKGETQISSRRFALNQLLSIPFDKQSQYATELYTGRRLSETKIHPINDRVRAKRRNKDRSVEMMPI
jgi:hypothetical protein